MPAKIFILYLILQFAFIDVQNMFGQISHNDSVLLSQLNAVRITDSAKSPIANSVRKITIDFLMRNGMDPSAYYTYSRSLLSVYQESHVFFFYKLGALREIYELELEGKLIIGSPGEPGDVIFMTYDISFNQVMHIYGNE
jgi:hypothetical protein